MPIEITGLKELRAELKALEGASVRELSSALREGAKAVTARANELAPEKSGKLKGNGRPFSSPTRAGVRYTLPYAGIQEFASTYLRSNPRRGGVTRGQKKAHFAGGLSVEGTNEVHYTKLGPPPRFAHKAVEELGPALIESTFARVVNVLKCHGWFK